MYSKPYGDDRLSFLGLGCMRFPQLGPNRTDPIDQEKTAQIIDYAIAHGINYFDTAHAYPGSEDALARAISRYPRERYRIATKYNAMGGPDYRTIFSQQLERLRTDYVDFYLIHAVMNEQSAENYIQSGCIEYFLEQKAAGRIRHLGFSSHAPIPVLERFADYTHWDFAQIQLNYLDWTLQDAAGQYRVLTERNIPIMVMEPLRGGRLATLSEQAGAMLKAAEPDWSLASWGFRWLRALPNVQVVLSGMSTMEQMEDNVRTFDAIEPLTDAQNTLLLQACEAFRKEFSVPCTACRYCCDDCPMQINIPAVMEKYNEYKISGATWGLSALKNAPGPMDCVGCGACAGHCPQSIAIPEIMAEIAEILKKD